MNSEGLYISNAIMEKYTSCIDNSSNNLDRTYVDTNTKFNGLIENGIYKNGFNNISKALSSTIDTLRNSNRVNKAYMSTFSTLEDRGSSLVESIEVPIISSVNNNLSLSNNKDITLYKEDGDSVKNNATSEVLYEDVYKIDNKDLNSMNSSYQEKEYYYDIIPEIYNAYLEEVKNNASEKVDFEDNYNVNTSQISNIKNNQTESVDFDDKHAFETKELKDINNSSDYNLEYIDKYNLDKINLEHINSLIEFEPLIEDKD